MLPIDDVLDAVCAAAGGSGRAVVTAAPASGKTTRVPPALARALGGRVVVLEPRRVAARSVARHLADGRGERLGESIGLTTRDERHVGGRTEVEFVTEGVLTRRLQRDPELRGVRAVVFDEFHERSLVADVGLALTLDVAGGLRPDLAVVVMSATLDEAALAAVLGDAPVIRAGGSAHPVATTHLSIPGGTSLESATATTVVEALDDGDGDVLVFLAGAPEIRRTARALDTALPSRWRDRVDVVPLHGRLPGADQDRALAAAPPGRRKVVLATNVAETSITVDGVRAVVDTGLVRRVRPGVGSGRFAELVTERVSRAEAEQRRGRAGRQAPGRCYRLWAERDHAGLQPSPRPEILVADLTGTALELAAWGVTDPAELTWLDPPPAAALTEGRESLRRLGLLDDQDRPTPDGRTVLSLGLDPRLGSIVLAGRRSGGDAVRLGCELAALLEEGDPLTAGPGDGGADIGLRLDALRHGGRAALPPGVDADRSRLRRITVRADTIERRLAALTERTGARPPGTARAGAGPQPAGSGRPDDDRAAALLLAGMADRIAQRRTTPDGDGDGRGDGRYRLRHGGGVRLGAADRLARAPFLVVADAAGTTGDGPDLAVRLALGVPAHLLPAGEPVVTVRWDPAVGDGGDVSARSERRLDALVLGAGPVSPATLAAADVAPALLDGVRRHGFGLLGNAEDAEALRRRVAFCRRVLGEQAWPDLSDEALLATLDTWLAPRLGNARRRRDLAAVDCRAAWLALLEPAAQAALPTLAPATVTVPTGRSVSVDYSGENPHVAVKLQELFGLRRLPELAGGRARLVAHLLSPAGRPVAVTDDLERFWTGAYRQVRAELRGRYPRHPWPEDPLAAVPTRTTNPRRR